MARSRLLALLVLTLLSGGITHAMAGVTSQGALALDDEQVDIIDFDYKPGSVTIKAGDTITWTNTGQEPHTVTADDGSFDSGKMGAGENFSMRFDSPGTYGYYCSLHGGPGGEGMSAVVIVEGGGNSEEPPSVDPEGDDKEGKGDEKPKDQKNEKDEPKDEKEGEGKDKPKANKKPKKDDANLPRTGSGPPPAWVFGLALAIMGFVLSRVARLSERAAKG